MTNLPQDQVTIDHTRPLAAVEAGALDALLGAFDLAAAYARGHLRTRGLGPGGVRAWGWPASGPLEAALVVREDISWAVWQAPGALPALAARLATLDVHLLSGPEALTAPILDTWPGQADSGQDRCPFEVLTPATFQPPPARDGRLARRATGADMDRLIDFYRHGFYSLAYLPTRAAWQARLEEQLAHRTTFIVELDGRVVAAAQSSAETPTCAMIGGVATLPSYRNQGLSGVCVGALCQALFAGGRRQVGLFYLPGNLPAARVYARLGFQPAGEWWLTRLPAPFGV